MQKILTISLWLWQLPQNLIGFFLTRKYEFKGFRVDEKMNEIPIYFKKDIPSVCLGDYIIINYAFLGKGSSIQTVFHERGHQLQSRIFGWFYLLLVGLPSVVLYWWDRLFHKNWLICRRNKWYYSKYPENWADRLGKVKRL